MMVEVTDEDWQVAERYVRRRGDVRPLEQVLAEYFARHRIAAEQRGKIEGARLAIEAAAGDVAGCYINPGYGENILPPFASDAIRALSPAKIVGEG